MALPVYRKRERDTRRVLRDGSFSKGMFYTSNFLDSSTTRLLLNYQVKDGGAYITPRMGLSVQDNREVLDFDYVLKNTDKVPGPHVKYYGVYRDEDGIDKFGDIIISFGVPADNNFRYYMTDKDLLNPEYYNQTYINGGNAFGFIKDVDDEWHPIDVSAIDRTRLRFYNYTPKPLYDVFNNKLYTIDGVAGEEVIIEEQTFSGQYTRLNNFVEYDGTFTQLTLRGISSKIEPIPAYRILVRDDRGVTQQTFEINKVTRSLPNGVVDQANVQDLQFVQRIQEVKMNTLTWTREEGVNVDLIHISKPVDARIYGVVSSSIFQSTRITDMAEVNTTYESIDNPTYIGSYSVRADLEDIIWVVTKGTEDTVITETLNARSLTYELNDSITSSISGPNTIRAIASGSLLLSLRTTDTFPNISYTLTYGVPIYKYLGGIQENKIEKKDGKFILTPTKIEAKEPIISEATSVGFNMLLPAPYSFENTTGLVLDPLGIMPYIPGSSQEIMMSANIGETIDFEVIYRYKTGDKYFTKWEYWASDASEPILLQDFQDTPFDAGERVHLEIKANDEKFALRVTMAPSITEDGKVVPDDNLSKVIVYPLYNAGNEYIKEISSVKYDLHNATGIGHYRTMLCLWGVPGADTTLFFSDVADTTYFPFPNNIISFEKKILGVQNYQGGLLVFTEDGIFLITGNQTSEFNVTELYQNLTFDKEDMESLIVVKNLIFIRSGENYYTLVPNQFTGETSDVKLTTVSGPIKEIVSDWDRFLQFLSTNLLDWDLDWGRDTVVEQYDFFNYVDDNLIKNVYRFAVYEDDIILRRYQIDIILVYNTTRGIWTVETMNLPFNDIVATSSGIWNSYVHTQGEKSKLYLQELDFRSSYRSDFYNTTAFDDAVNDDHTSSRESELQKYPNPMTDKVVRVVDGDTIELETLGSTRFLYVNAPEDTTTHEDFGPEATSLISDLLPVGSTVTVEFEGDRSDKYDRALAWITSETGKLAQLALAEAGLVLSVYAYGQTKYADIIDAAIKKSVEDKVGIWRYDSDGPKYIYTTKTEDLIPNYQILDTGNKDHDVYLKKRFREFQFQIANKSDANLDFYLRNYIEAVPLRDYRSYEITHNTDRNSDQYGIIMVVPVDTPNVEVATATYLNVWQLDTNMFPDLDTVKVRFKTQGKGYYSRILLISKNQKNYDIQSYAWVFRAQNHR